MAFLDFIKGGQANQQQPVAQQTQQQETKTPSVDSMPAEARSQAVEAARPAAEIMDRATTPKSAPAQPQNVPDARARSRSLSMER